MDHDKYNFTDKYCDGNSEFRENRVLLTTFRLAVIDFLLLTLSFYIVSHIKRGSIDLPQGYLMLLFLFYFCWLVSGWVAKKFLPSSYTGYREAVWVMFKSILYLTFTVVFVVVMFGLSRYSRVQVFATCGLFWGLEMLLWAVAFRFISLRCTNGEKEDLALDEASKDVRKSGFSYRFVILDLGLLLGSFFMVNIMKRDQWGLLPGYEKLLLLLVFLWFGVSLSTRKFYVLKQKNLYFAVWQWLKAGMLMLAVTGVMVFGLRIFHYSRTQGFGTILLLMALELLALVVYFSARKEKKETRDIESVDQVKQILGQTDYDLHVDMETIRRQLMQPATHKLLRYFQSDNMEFFDFLESHVNIKEILYVETLVDQTCDAFPLRDDFIRLRLFINLQRINNYRRLNARFLQIHQMLHPGGYFAGYAHTIQTHHEWVYSRYPRQLAHVIYALDFCVHRVIPKLPWVQKVYFAWTKGKDRIISRAEVLGRLCFCGFEIVATKEINKRLYFIARKVKTSSLDKSPTYGPLVALKRSGYGGGVVHTYKFRTMHPYSEYLQQYMYDHNGLQKGGKIENDFRMTTWGKVMRKLWLDELPMLYNWLKGDFGIVGVRPLSFHFLSLYDADLQELRKRVRPGLVPPFYADLPETFEEICDSERRYIRAYLEHPFRTQIWYFYKSFINIVIKGARSN